MRAARLVTLMLLLEGRERMTARELAAELEVSARTVHRDIEALSSAGVPVYAERGARGGFRLLEGHRLQLNGLTTDEAAALAFAGTPSAASELGVYSASRSAGVKLASALAPDARAAWLHAAAEVLIDVDPWEPAVVRTAIVRALRRAIERRRVVRVCTDRVSDVEIAPLGLVRKAGAWHLVAARAHGRDVIPVATITEIAATARRFERPAGFDLAAWWHDWVAVQAPADRSAQAEPRSASVLRCARSADQREEERHG